MNVYSGHKIDPLHIKKEDIYLEDIAHALSLLCRGNGHIKYFYSVAQHSLNCAKEAQLRGYSKHVVLSCLFHDASETYMSDHIQLKNEEKNVWKEMDHLLLEAELKEMMPLEEDRPTAILISVPDLNEHYYREIEEEFKAYALQLLEDL